MPAIQRHLLPAAIVALILAAAAAFPPSAVRAAPTVGELARLGQTASRPAQDVPSLYDDSVVRDMKITFEQDDWLALLQANGCRQGGPGQPSTGIAKDVPATIEIDGTRLDRVGVRCKGNSSQGINGSKKPLNLTTDSFEPGQDLWGFDVLNLNNNYNDPSQLRDAVALRLLSDYMPISRFVFTRVTINGAYIGLYTMVEQINGEWADHWFNDSGLIVRGDSPVRIAFESSTLNWKGEDLAPYKQGYEVKGSLADEDPAYERVRELTRALDAPVANGGVPDADVPAAVEQRMNVDSALWHIAGTSILAHYDSYYVGKNYYLFAGERDPRFSVIMWDLGLAFGTFGYRAPGGGGRPGGGGTGPALVDPFVQEDAASRPLIRRLLAVPQYRADYLAHYRTLLNNILTEERLLEVGERYQALIRDAVQQEATEQGTISGSYTFAQFLSNLRTAITGNGGRGMGTPGLLALVHDRRAYLVARPDMQSPDLALANHSLAPAVPATDEEVVVTAMFGGAAASGLSSVDLRYRIAGGPEVVLAMSATGGGWSATLPAQRSGRRVTYYFRTGLADGNAGFFPEANWTAPFHYDVAAAQLPQAPLGDLVLNELMSRNTATIADEAGNFADWVELYNRGSAPVALGGLFLSDDAADPWAYALPDQMLAPGAYLLVWCDNDAKQGPLHAPFRLDSKGETLTLSSRTETLDRVAFGELRIDESLGRRSDGDAEWALCGTATPRGPNACSGRLPDTPTPSPTATTTPTVPPSATPKATAIPRERVFLPWAQRSR
jgi:spore coat protein CotH